MAYIGREPQVGNFQVCDAISVVNGQAAYTMQVNSVNVSPETANHMLVSLNGVLQAPGSSYTVSGSTITFASNLVTGDVINFIHILGSVLDLGVPSDSTVTNAKTNFVSTSSAAGLQIKGDGTTDGTLQLNCSQNSHGVKLKSPAHSSAQSYTLTLPATAPSSGKALVTDGSGNLSFSSAGGLNLISTTNVSSASTVDITGMDSTYKNYKIIITNLNCANDSEDLTVRFIIGGSAKSDSYYNYFNHLGYTGGYAYNASQDATAAKLVYGSIGNAADESLSSEIFIPNPSETTFRKMILAQSGYIDNDANTRVSHNMTHYENSTAALTGLQFAMSSGNIDSAIIKLYGIS